MNIWKIILLLLFGITLLVHANQHGQKREPYDFWMALIAISIELFLLYMAGFFLKSRGETMTNLPNDIAEERERWEEHNLSMDSENIYEQEEDFADYQLQVQRDREMEKKIEGEK